MRQVSDRRSELRLDPDGDELLEPRARTVDHTECAVPGPGQRHGRVDQLAEQRLERELRAQRDPGLDERADALGSGGGEVRHGAGQLDNLCGLFLCSGSGPGYSLRGTITSGQGARCGHRLLTEPSRSPSALGADKRSFEVVWKANPTQLGAAYLGARLRAPA